jgi:hypothetical protein
MQRDSRPANAFYTVIAVLVMVAMFLCASGSGNPDTAQPLPDWVNTSINVLNVLVGLLVMVPRTRAFAAIAAALNMVGSMVTNYTVDGYAYFLKALPFDAVSLVLAAMLVWHYRADLARRASVGLP